MPPAVCTVEISTPMPRLAWRSAARIHRACCALWSRTYRRPCRSGRSSARMSSNRKHVRFGFFARSALPAGRLPASRTRCAAEIIRIVALYIALFNIAVAVAGVAERSVVQIPGVETRIAVVAWERTPGRAPLVAVRAAPVHVIAWATAITARIRGEPSLSTLSLPRPGRPENDAPFATSPVRDRVANRKARAVRQRRHLTVQRIGWIPPNSIFRPPTARDHVGALRNGPGKCIGLLCEPSAEVSRICMSLAFGATPDAP